MKFFPWKLGFWFNEQWSCFFKRNCSWYDFTFIKLEFEITSGKHGPGRAVEFYFSLLGINIGIDVYHAQERQDLLTATEYFVKKHAPKEET